MQVVNSRYVLRRILRDAHEWPEDVIAGHYVGGCEFQASNYMRRP